MKRFTDLRQLQQLKQETKRENRMLATQYRTHANEVKKKELEEQERLDLEELERMQAEEDARVEKEKQETERSYIRKERTYTDDQLSMIGTFLRENRRKKGISQTDFEKKIKWYLGMCSNVETGRYKGLDLENLRSIFFALDLTDGEFQDFRLELDSAKRAAFARTGNPRTDGKFKCVQTKNIQLSNEAGTLEFYCNIDISEFTVYFMNEEGKRIELYRGPRNKNNEFFDMLEELMRRARKEL